MTERMPEVRSVALGYWVGVGSRDEPAALQGSSHFLEHLLFKGTHTRSARDIAETFDAVGGEANAFSEKEYTCYYGRVLDRDLPMAAEVLSDMIQNSIIAAPDIEAERNVILEELAMLEDTPEDLIHDFFAETVFEEHPLGREVMGTVETVASIDQEALRAFHRDNYRSHNIVVAAAGNVDHDDVVRRVGDAFGSSRERFTRQTVEPAPKQRLRILNRHTEGAHLIVGGLGYPSRHPLRFAWGVLDTLLGGGMSSRLFQEIREIRGLAYSVFSYRNLFTETGAYGIYAGTAPGNAQEVVKLITREMDVMLESGVTEAELQRAKGHMKGAVVLTLEDPASRMTRLGKSEIVGGEILSIDEILARVEEVTLEDVSMVAKELLQPESRILTAIGPFREEDFADWPAAG
ncbi:MAG TPA: pitrilysin family protein [Actinomycetota bacterium]|nr:pitrilysin family protein [Actinomycetota bacterium]